MGELNNINSNLIDSIHSHVCDSGCPTNPVRTRSDSWKHRLRCKSCDYDWNYLGRRRTKTSCPSCGKKVSIKTDKIHEDDFI